MVGEDRKKKILHSSVCSHQAFFVFSGRSVKTADGNSGRKDCVIYIVERVKTGKCEDFAEIPEHVLQLSSTFNKK